MTMTTKRLVPPESLKETLLSACPERCRDWTEEQWHAAGRLAMLARLLWDVAREEADEANREGSRAGRTPPR